MPPKLTDKELSKLKAKRDQAEFEKKAKAERDQQVTKEKANEKEHRLTTSTKGQFCDPSKTDDKNQPAHDCKTKLIKNLEIVRDFYANASDEKKTQIVKTFQTKVLKKLGKKSLVGIRVKQIVDTNISFEDFFNALIENKYNGISLFKDENEYANVGGSKEFKEFYKNYKNPPTATATTSTTDELQTTDGEQPVVEPEHVVESTNLVVDPVVAEAKTTDSDTERSDDDRDVNSTSSDPDDNDDESIASNANNNDTPLISATVAAPIPNRLNIELHATTKGFFVKIQTDTENPPSDVAGYEYINTNTALDLIQSKIKDDKFKSFLTVFNGLYVNEPISGTDTSGIIIKIIIVDNTGLKIKIDRIETPEPLNSESEFTKITQFDPSIEPLNTIIAQIPPDFLQRFHTAYNAANP